MTTKTSTGVSYKSVGFLLAKTWEPTIDPNGWWMSEKLDGVRAKWDPTKREFVSRLGNPFPVPEWFKEGMPNVALDGELWAGRGNFQDAVSIVRCASRDNGWKKITYLVFDAPEHPGSFEERLGYLAALLLPPHPSHAVAVRQLKCKGLDDLLQTLKTFEAQGAEGLMLRKQGSKYEGKRSSTLLKVKTFSDAEATIIGVNPGERRLAGTMGALVCEMANGKRFECGSGFTDAQRAEWWANRETLHGTRITYRFQELSREGIPRFPTFVAVRNYE